MNFSSKQDSWKSIITYIYELNAFIFCTVYESFKEYVTPEKLEGDNKYDAGEFGMQVG